MSNKKEFFNKLAGLLEEYDVDIYSYHAIERGSDIAMIEVWGGGLLADVGTLDAETCRKIAGE